MIQNVEIDFTGFAGDSLRARARGPRRTLRGDVPGDDGAVIGRRRARSRLRDRRETVGVRTADPSRNSSTVASIRRASGPWHTAPPRRRCETATWRITNTRASSRWTTRASPSPSASSSIIAAGNRRLGPALVVANGAARGEASGVGWGGPRHDVRGGIVQGGYRTPCSATNEPHPRSATARAWRASWTPRRTRDRSSRPGNDDTAPLEHPSASSSRPSRGVLSSNTTCSTENSDTPEE